VVATQSADHAEDLPEMQIGRMGNKKGESMSETTERARLLIESIAAQAAEKAALAAELNQTIADAKAALVALGVKRQRKPREVKAAKRVRKPKGEAA
jgi:hypothetical protein